MPHFHYRVRDRRGKSYTGEIEAATTQAASEALSQQGYYPISITRTQTVSFSVAAKRPPRIKSEDLTAFTRQLWSLQKAGLPLLSGLSALKEQAHKQNVKDLIGHLSADLEKGDSLSAAFAKHPKIFRPVYVHMIRAGEVSGKLEEVFLQLSDMEKFEKETRDKIRSATLYPTMTLCSIVLAFLGVITFVIPRFADLYGKFGAKLPLPTRVLLKINDILQHHLLELILIVGAATFLFRLWAQTDGGRRAVDMLKLKIPIFGELVFNLQMMRFSRILGDMTKSGVPILQSLQLVSDTMSNSILQGAILRVHKSVNEGKGMSAPMRETKLFAPLIIQMIDVGEQTGRMDDLLGYVGEYYQDRANMTIKNLSILIEPILLFIMGGMILLLAAGVFMPVWNLVNVIHS